MGDMVMKILLESNLLLLTGGIVSALVGGVLGVIAARPLAAFLRNAAGFLVGAALGAVVFGLVASVLAAG
jgi:hypothetical protein